MASVQYRAVTHRYPGAEAPSVDRLDLDIADGEFLVLVGPSGCGKSTTLRMLAGLEPVASGSITIGDVDVTALPARARDVAMVFQNYALYPNMTVAGNMGFALRNAGVSRADTKRRVEEVAAMLELTELLDRKPSKLSGGQRQRVAMGRAIVRRPRVFCMDEPLSNLDAKLRVSTRSQISGLQRRLGTTTVYVTHDQVEAMTMGDRVAVLKDVVLQQVDTPRALYDDPVNTFVATFIGAPSMNLLEVAVADGTVRSAGLGIPVPRGASERVLMGVRPESWDVTPAGTPGALSVHVELVEELGFESFVYATPLGNETGNQRIVFRTDRRTAVGVGETLAIVPHPHEVCFFDSETTHRIG
ncbi:MULTISPECIES: ABC transporter ATP-binding protein [Mycobacterium]|uniref:Trehalose import ATP-binding protein SugC n=1 Tax=Mycobacterium kiyosense TaxID=2871094 RepID=A0A9P3Q506_9MYCO|nr:MULTISPECIES: ATP-binding cassette domain-containing protein [Mycobacterium]BDB43481.1 sugar ABC transporter ATP-binding protein [Mycobacterium kiyosense]BDE13358.1 sugar ABC transporter ATP-binding protein [Mycobacterium sp. 20KCMC460]GLB86566.1 sugar ABC transporter ATP-binding protein [Mycobacterium kiyosense]GLB92305.1 sugar ABC transporter ATP-binding protein [Mycobacterium kiyosense]GLB98289.1 sugar ABC transporter ATP-binding protein [Mycobacterium kiyosense]